jgi:WD40 repeat protein
MDVYAVKWIPDRPILVTASLDAAVKLEGHSGYVLSLAVDPAGHVVVSGCDDVQDHGTLKLDYYCRV